MSLNDILALGDRMIASQKLNGNVTSAGPSSALGNYQIVGTTLRGLMKELKLTGEELFSPMMQDKLASRLVAEKGGDTKALQNTWIGLQKVDSALIQKALNVSQSRERPGPWNTGAAPSNSEVETAAKYSPVVIEFTEETKSFVEGANKRILDLKALEGRNAANKGAQETIEAFDNLKIDLETLGADLDGTKSKYEDVIASIKKGKVNPENLNPLSEEYKNLLVAAKEYDETSKRVSAGKEALKAKEDFTTRQVELAARVKEANARMNDPLERQSTSGYRKLQSDLEDYVTDAERAYGKDSQNYKDAVAYKKSLLAQLNQAKSYEQAVGWAKRARDIRTGLMSEK
ncbi:MAG: hypothetical protein ACEQSB_07415, partial [Undibacterium sp.]